MGYENNALINAKVQGVVVTGLRSMRSQYDGYCTQTGRKFTAGTEILFKGKNQLSEAEAEIFKTRRKPVYSISVIKSAAEIVTGFVAPSAPRGRKKPTFKPSKYQEIILNAFLDSNNHILIRALAGSGKTSTLVWLIHEMIDRGRDHIKTIYLAFNRNIRDELVEKLQGTNVPAKTTHGFTLVDWIGGKDITIMKGNKKNEMFFLKAICDQLRVQFDHDGKKQARRASVYELRTFIYDLVGFIKNWAIAPSYELDGGWKFSEAQMEEIDSLIDRYRIPVSPEAREDVVDWACRVVSYGTPAPGDTIQYADYDDMLYYPIVLNLPTPRVDEVLTDESQDFNRAQLILIERLLKAGARITAVGDENQGLYRFRGAAGQSMSWLGDLFRETRRGLRTCELPVNYRSAKAVIRWAQTWVPDLQGFREEEGEVNFDHGFDDTLDMVENRTDKSYAFLCRTNAPLVRTAYELIARRKRIHILGREGLATPVLSLISELCGQYPTDGNYCNRISDLKDHKGEVIQEGLLTRLKNHMDTQRIKLAGEEYRSRLESLENLAECVEIISSHVRGDTVDEVRNEIEQLFADGPEPGVINLATIHGAKGLEWDWVGIIRPDLLPHPMVKVYDRDGNYTEEYQQELNACYVAATRARNQLYYVMDFPVVNGKGMGPIAFLPSNVGYGSQAADEEGNIDPHEESSEALQYFLEEKQRLEEKVLEVSDSDMRDSQSPQEVEEDDDGLPFA